MDCEAFFYSLYLGADLQIFTAFYSYRGAHMGGRALCYTYYWFGLALTLAYIFVILLVQIIFACLRGA
jgi:hypothetical protein